jgi:hypothetical protein
MKRWLKEKNTDIYAREAGELIPSYHYLSFFAGYVGQCFSNCGPLRFARWSAAVYRRVRKENQLQELYQILNE